MSDVMNEYEISPDEALREGFREVLSTLPTAPIATIFMMTANVAVYALMVAQGVDPMNPGGETLLSWGANFGPLTMSGQWWRLFSCMFLHFGALHLGMNMLVLWGLGRPVERFVGSVGLAIAYLASGVAGSLASLAWHPQGISAGASGAVFGTAGTLLGFALLRRDTIPPEVRTALLKSMANFLILNTVVGLSMAQIDMAAHLGGFIGGMLCGLILSQPLLGGMLLRRKYKNLATLLAAIVVLPIVAVALPAAPPDLKAELLRISEVKKGIYDSFNSANAQAAEDAISGEDFADRIELVILPAWLKYRQDLERLSLVEYASKPYFEKMLKYAELRQDSWQSIALALREVDSEKKADLLKRAGEADRRIQELFPVQ